MSPEGQPADGGSPVDAPAAGGPPVALRDQMRRTAERSRVAWRRCRGLGPADRAAALNGMADALAGRRGEILEANAADCADGRAAGLSPALLDRLGLDPPRMAAMERSVRAIAEQPDVLGEVLDDQRRADGLRVRRLRAPIGVVAIIYESRPNVTVDAAALCVKAGNTTILRGGSEALRSNGALRSAVADGVQPWIPPDAVQLVPIKDRAAVPALLAHDDLIDLVIPRGGEALVRAVAECTRIPMLKHAKGVCHVYVDRAADFEMAERIIENAKCQRPGVCNAAETLLVHREVADAFLPSAGRRLRRRGVELRCDPHALPLVEEGIPATDDDWPAEYLDLVLAVAVVDDLDAAIAHIERHGSRHSDAIVTEDEAAARRFLAEVDSAAVYWNASTRFTDGAEFGLGAEIGISTDKLHARGPCGVRELTTWKWVVEGRGQVRE